MISLFYTLSSPVTSTMHYNMFPLKFYHLCMHTIQDYRFSTYIIPQQEVQSGCTEVVFWYPSKKKKPIEN